MLGFVEHPATLVVIAIAGSPVLLPLARFFFEDIETFKSEAGLDYEHNRWLWLLGWPRLSLQLQLKVVGFVGIFGILVALLYITVCRVLY